MSLTRHPWRSAFGSETVVRYNKTYQPKRSRLLSLVIILAANLLTAVPTQCLRGEITTPESQINPMDITTIHSPQLVSGASGQTTSAIENQNVAQSRQPNTRSDMAAVETAPSTATQDGPTPKSSANRLHGPRTAAEPAIAPYSTHQEKPLSPPYQSTKQSDVSEDDIISTTQAGEPARMVGGGNLDGTPPIVPVAVTTSRTRNDINNEFSTQLPSTTPSTSSTTSTTSQPTSTLFTLKDKNINQTATTSTTTTSLASISTSTSTTPQPLNVFITASPRPHSSTQPSAFTSAATAPASPQSLFHPLLIYSIRYEIRSFDLISSATNRAYNGFSISNPSLVDQHQFGQKHSPGKTMIAGLKNTIGLDFYYSPAESYIFWIDVMEERIFRGALTNGVIANVNVIAQGGLASAEGLAVDWIGKNLYWVESTLDRIEVANMNGSCRRTLIAGDMESPRAISVDPRYGLMFWTDWDKRSPRIERATMSGDDRRKLVDIKEVNGGWPNGLTLDFDALKIYWIDANSDSIHVVDYEGRNHKSLLRKSKSLGHPFAITLFDTNLYWTDWMTNLISVASKHGGSEPKEVQRQQSRLFDIKVFHPSRQPRLNGNATSACDLNNGNCSHLCLLSTNGTRVCMCPHLMRLTQDNRTCEPYERVLLIGRSHEIRAVDIAKPMHHIMSPITIPKVFNPRQFEYDTRSLNIFWADSATNEVKRAQLAGNNIETIIDVIIEAPSGLALDWISGNIYVTSAAPLKSGKIFISNLNGEFISILMDSQQGVVSPKSVAVHPLLGLLFCIDETANSEPLIFVANMAGANKRIIASKQYDSSLSNPSNLAIDLESNRVYWVNQANSPTEKATIQYYDIAKDFVITIYDEAELPLERRINPGVLCVDGDHLIISSRPPIETIIRANKNNITDRAVYKTQMVDQILALRVYNSSSQVGTNACSVNNGGCSQLCVPTDASTRVCKCTMGYTISATNETQCLGRDKFLIFSYNLGMKGIGLEPNTSPEEYHLPPIHRAFRASSIDYVHRDNLIYWVDNEEGVITRINRDTTGYQIVIQGLESEECIAIDWVAGNIYWLDPYHDIIEVARLNGTNRFVIVSGDMDKANGIAVDPINGYLVWSDIGLVPKIESARLDGSDRRVVVSTNLVRIDDLAIDYATRYIYWVDSTLSTIERVKIDGTDRQRVYGDPNNAQTLQHHLVSIALHESYIYFADSAHNQGSIFRLNKAGNASNVATHVHQSLGEGIRDIAIFEEQPYPRVEQNPCVANNGGCQDLCLFLGQPGRSRCICSHGKLRADGLTCEPYDTFLMFSKLSQIDSLHIQDEEPTHNTPYQPITIESKGSIISLTIDHGAQRVIYSEMTRDQICSVHFNGTDRKVLVEKQSLVEGIAFARNQLYWTSIHDNSISRLNTSSSGTLQMSCSGDTCEPAYVEKLVKLSDEDKPRGIAIDSCTDYVYWTNWNVNASIQRASPQTGYKIEYVIRTNIRVPNGLAIDHSQRKLYWCDARLDKIETCNMDGTGRIVLISALPQHPFALAVWKDYIFWTDWLARGVFKADKYTGQQAVQIKKVAQRPMGIAVASPEAGSCKPDPCATNNGNCPADHDCHIHHHYLGMSAICVKRGPSTGDEIHKVAAEMGDLLIRPGQGPCTRREDGIRCANSRDKSPTEYHDILRDNLERYRPSQHTLYDEWSYPGATGEPMSVTIASSERAQQPGHSSFPTAIELRQPTTGAPSLGSTTTTRTTTARFPYAFATRSRIPTATTPRAAATGTLAPVTSSLQFNSRVDSSSQQPTSSSTKSGDTPPTVTAGLTAPPCQTPTGSPQTISPADALTGHSECKAQSEFKCYLSEKLICIASEKRCDGQHDCPSKEDESDCGFSSRGQYNPKHESDWHRYVTVILIILCAALAALFMVFGQRGRRRWFVNSNNGFNHSKMFEDNGTNIEISNPMFDEDDNANLVNCPFSIDLDETTTNFSNPLYERQILLVNDKTPKT